VFEATAAGQQAGAQRVYFGTYTRGQQSKGIYAASLDPATGKLGEVTLVAESDNPSFLAIRPDGKYLYAVNETADFGGEKSNSGGVSAFAIDPATGKLNLLNQQPTRGAAPCHLVVDRTGQWLLSANYSGGSVCVHPIGADGKLGASSSFVQHQGKSVNPRRQDAPHAHSINLDPANRFAFVADLGLDKVLSYQFDARQGTLTANPSGNASVQPGAGPRHFAFRPDSRFAFTNNEIASTVTALRYDVERGALEEVNTVSTLPAGFSGNNSTAECQAHPSGKFVYVSNRGHNSIAIFSTDAESGRLTHIGNESTQGRTPRNFGIDPTGTFLLAENQASSSVVVFRIDAATGKLQATGQTIEVPSPVCAKFLVVAK
jgi:6-phosphogluconolactonase